MGDVRFKIGVASITLSSSGEKQPLANNGKGAWEIGGTAASSRGRAWWEPLGQELANRSFGIAVELSRATSGLNGLVQLAGRM